MFNVIVIGGGPAGVTAALRASELGAQVALVERGQLGGACSNDGCVPTRVLAKAARLRREAGHFEEYGLIGELPAVDFPRLLARTQQTVYQLHEKKQLVAHLQQSGVTVYTGVGNAQFLDEHAIVAEDGTHLQADKFILCVGGHTRRLAFPGVEYSITHRDVWSLKSLPLSVAVIGGAATGCQLASILAAFGSQVSILLRGDRLLHTEDRLVSQVMAESFHRHGIHVCTNVGVERLERPDGTSTLERPLRLWYTHQGEMVSLDVEAVILAAGWASNADPLNLAAAGVQVENGYVTVDSYLRTSAPHIFAAGDINGRMMLVQSAGYEARIAAENAVLGVGQPYTHQIVPHGGFTDPEYAGVGLTEEEARAAEPDCLVAVVPFADTDRAVIDDHTVGFCKLVVSQETHRILGAHIVGEQALEAIQLVAAGMAADMWVEQLAELELAYPTYTAIVGLAARRLVRDLGVMPLAPEWRALGKPHAAEWERSEG